MGEIFVQKGIPNKRNTGEFKQMVVETMIRKNHVAKKPTDNLKYRATHEWLRGKEST